MNKAVIYCRKSQRCVGPRSFSNPNDLSLERQKNICLEYCKNNNLKVTKIYSEIASARNMNKLKELNLLLNKVNSNIIILVSDVSRFSRNVYQALEKLEILRSKNVSVHSIHNNITYDNNPNNRHEFRRLLSCAEYESDIYSERIKKSLNFRKKNNCKIGRSRFGYESFYDNKGFRRERINKREQYIFRLIGSKNRSGFNYPQIADFLNNKNYTFRNKEWTSQRVRYVYLTHKNQDTNQNVTDTC
jgi:DNA invertase Pin-like site-specific DNA recombinase